MGKTDDWMPLRLQIWRSGTAFMMPEARGPYLDLILAYWELGPLPNDDGVLQSNARVSDQKLWRRIRTQVVAKFKERDGVLYHERCDAERTLAKQLYERKASAGRSGGKAKAVASAKQKASAATAEDAANGQAKSYTTNLESSADADIPPSAGADGVAVDPAKWVYDIGKGTLKTYKISAKTAGGLITSWLKRLDAEQLLAVIANAAQQRRHDIVAFIEGSIRTRTNGRNHDNSEQQRTDREAIARAFGDRGLAPVRPAAGSVDGEPTGEHGDAAPVRVIALPTRGTDGGDRATDGLRPDVQPADPKSLGPDRTIPAGYSALTGRHFGQSGQANNGLVEVGEPDADAGGHPRVGAPLPDAEKNGGGTRSDRVGETDNADELDIPDFLDRRQIAV